MVWGLCGMSIWPKPIKVLWVALSPPWCCVWSSWYVYRSGSRRNNKPMCKTLSTSSLLDKESPSIVILADLFKMRSFICGTWFERISPIVSWHASISLDINICFYLWFRQSSLSIGPWLLLHIAASQWWIINDSGREWIWVDSETESAFKDLPIVRQGNCLWKKIGVHSYYEVRITFFPHTFNRCVISRINFLPSSCTAVPGDPSVHLEAKIDILADPFLWFRITHHYDHT